VDRIQVFINKCPRKILNIHWPDRITNKELWKKMSEQPVLEQLRRRNGTGLDTHRDEAITALPNKCYSGCHKATEEEDDRETLGKEIWR